MEWLLSFWRLLRWRGIVSLRLPRCILAKLIFDGIVLDFGATVRCGHYPVFRNSCFFCDAWDSCWSCVDRESVLQVLIPFLFSAFAVYISKPQLIYAVCYLKNFYMLWWLHLVHLHLSDNDVSCTDFWEYLEFRNAFLQKSTMLGKKCFRFCLWLFERLLVELLFSSYRLFGVFDRIVERVTGYTDSCWTWFMPMRITWLR